MWQLGYVYEQSSDIEVEEGGVSAVTGAVDEQGSAMGLKGLLKRSAFAALASGALSLSVVAITPSASGASTKASSSSGGTATMALDENLVGFNINTSAASEFVLQEIMNMVWPQAFIVNSKLQPVINNQLLESAAQTSDSPQTVVYTLNPKLEFSDESF